MLVSNNNFNHIKVHTQYSICEGAVKIDELADYCKLNKIKSIGLADSYNLCGALEFSEKISKTGTQPIIGTQINLSIFDIIGKVTLYATSEKGYKNLLCPSRKELNLENNQEVNKWFDLNKRDLPFRKNRNPYRTWVSEIMLQQTQVKTVIPFFKKFIQKYPNLKSIASASEDDILAMWTGLGFYRRAKNIYKTKEIIKREYGNRFPKEFNELLMLP